MKKHLIAAAVAAAVAVPAAAQVTITGNMDIAQTQSKTSQTNDDNNVGRTSTVKGTDIQGNGGTSPYSSSMLKFDAKEDLGGGLTAFATHEVSLNNSGVGPAAPASFGTSRQSFIGLSGGFGTLTIGYQYAHEHNVLNGAGNAGTNNSIGTLQNGGLGKTTRHDMIQWLLPKFGGIQVVGQYGKEDASTAVSNVAPDRAALGSEFMSLGAEYSAGALTLRGGFSQNELELAATAPAAATTLAVLGLNAAVGVAAQPFDVKADIDAVYLGGNYNLGAAQLFANFADRDAKTSGSANQVRADELKINVKSYDVGVRVPLGATMLWASIGDGETKVSVAGAPNFQQDVSAYQLGAYHALSKRTGVYALMGEQKNDETTSAQANKEQTTAKTMAFGVRHSF